MAAGVGWDGQEVPHAAGEQPLENNLVASVTWMMPQAMSWQLHSGMCPGDTWPLGADT